MCNFLEIEHLDALYGTRAQKAGDLNASIVARTIWFDFLFISKNKGDGFL